MKHVFCLDTNVLRDEKGESWIKEKEIDKLLPYGIVIIPEIVLEEIEQKAIRGFEKEKQTLGSKLKAFFGQQIEEVDIAKKVKDHIGSILSKEGVNMIKLTNFAVLPEMKKLAILKQPPFEGNEGTDKGFKDCYIYFTLLEYQNKNPSLKLFFWTKDKRLQSACHNTSIQIIESIEDYEKNFWLTDYLRGQIADRLETNVGNVSLLKSEININDNKLLAIQLNQDGESRIYRFELDREEIISYIFEEDISKEVNSTEDVLYALKDALDKFINTWSFFNTHISIIELEEIDRYLFNDEIIEILTAITTNPQIYKIIRDEDVLNFVEKLFQKRKDMLEESVRGFIENLLK